MLKIGVLSYQGSVIEHINALKKIKGVEAAEVKYLEQLMAVDGIILPGGESTAIGKMLRRFGLFEPLKKRIEQGMPVWGTCAGMILLAKNIAGQNDVHLGVMDITVRRNAYGSQLDSFTTSLTVKSMDKPCEAVFIRAPWIESINPPAEAISTHNGRIVGARQSNMIVTSFHPELTRDNSFHQYFADVIKQSKN